MEREWEGTGIEERVVSGRFVATCLVEDPDGELWELSYTAMNEAPPAELHRQAVKAIVDQIYKLKERYYERNVHSDG